MTSLRADHVQSRAAEIEIDAGPPSAGIDGGCTDSVALHRTGPGPETSVTDVDPHATAMADTMIAPATWTVARREEYG